jgi:electron transfer flavoprotein beta subunit
VKYVPEITSDRVMDSGRLVRDPAVGLMNELDEHAVEAALQLVEALPDEDARESSQIIALTVAPSTGDMAIKKAYQMGAERGIRVTDDAFAGLDYHGTAAVLAAAVRRLGSDDEGPIDVVLCGLTALDGLGSVIPAMLAEELGWPQLTHSRAVALGADGRSLNTTRETEESVEELTAPLPAVVSVTDAANEPRMPNFKRIMAARTKAVEEWSAADVEPFLEDFAPRVSVVDAAVHPPRVAGDVVVDRGEGGTVLANYLIEKGLV